MLTVVTLLFLTGLFEELPEATLAGVVIAALVELVDIPALVALFRAYTRGLGRIYGFAARPDFIAAMSALLGVLVFDTLPGLFIGIAVSIVLLLYRASRPHVAVLGRASGPDGPFVDVERTPGGRRGPRRRRSCGSRADCSSRTPTPCATASARTLPTRHVRAIVLDAETIPCDRRDGRQHADQLADDLQDQGKRLVLAREVGQLRDELDHTPSGQGPIIETYPTVRAAVDALRED